MVQTRASSLGAFRAWTGILGALLVLLGGFAFTAPFLAGIAANLAFGGALVVAGVLRIVYAAKGGASGRVGISALLGTLGIVAGALLLLRPLLGLLSLTLLIGGYLVAHGVLETYAAFQWKRRGRPWGFMLIDGAVAFFLGGLMLLEWPISGLFTLGVFTAVHLALVGVGLLIAAITPAPDESARVPPARATMSHMHAAPRAG